MPNTGQLIDHRHQPVQAGVAGIDGAHVMPGRQEPPVGGGADRLDLGAQRRQRTPPQNAQHVGVTPLLGPGAAGRPDAHAVTKSPRTSRPSPASRSSTSAVTRSPRPNRAAASAVVNGVRVRA